MKAAVFHGAHQPLTIEDIELDSPGPQEIVVRTEATGVCHSDLHFVDGFYPYASPAVLGHEAAGVVEEVGEHVTYVQPGDHVIACLSVFCGSCDYCLTGRPNLFQDKPGRSAKGRPFAKWQGSDVSQFANISSYAEKMLLHENAVVKIAKALPLDKMALIGCGVITGAGAAMYTAKVEPGSSVAVFGAGGVGLAAIQGARIAGARQIIAIDMLETKLATAKELGATHIVDGSSGDPVQKIKDLTGGLGVEYSFEAIGNKKASEQAYMCLAPGGTATIVGMVPVGQNIEIPGNTLLQERKLQGSSMGSNRFRRDMPRLIDFYQQGRLKLDEMVTRTGKLEDINEAFRAMKAGEVARTVLLPNG